MEQILQHYDAYINKLCLRTMVDESGQTHKQVDPYMKGRLQSKLMQAITNQIQKVAGSRTQKIDTIKR